MRPGAGQRTPPARAVYTTGPSELRKRIFVLYSVCRKHCGAGKITLGDVLLIISYCAYIRTAYIMNFSLGRTEIGPYDRNTYSHIKTYKLYTNACGEYQSDQRARAHCRHSRTTTENFNDIIVIDHSTTSVLAGKFRLQLWISLIPINFYK